MPVGMDVCKLKIVLFMYDQLFWNSIFFFASGLFQLSFDFV